VSGGSEDINGLYSMAYSLPALNSVHVGPYCGYSPGYYRPINDSVFVGIISYSASIPASARYVGSLVAFATIWKPIDEFLDFGRAAIQRFAELSIGSSYDPLSALVRILCCAGPRMCTTFMLAF
jgi:hypothetical protein